MKKLSLIICILTLTATLYAKRSDNNGVNNFINRDESFASSLDIKVKDPNTAKSTYSTSDSTRTGSVRDRIIDFAKTKLGATYVWGATGPNVFDCSGFVKFVFQNAADISLPRVSSDQATYKPRISSINMKKGDLVFFETTGWMLQSMLNAFSNISRCRYAFGYISFTAGNNSSNSNDCNN